MPFVDDNRKLPAQLGINLIERERHRIAEELHDDVASKLSIIRYKLQANLPVDSETLGLLDSVMKTVRHLSCRLYNPFLNQIKFIDALKDYLVLLHRLIKIELHHTADFEVGLSKLTKLHLLRITQEVINNIIKHSMATDIIIKIWRIEDNYNLLIWDNGRGFDHKKSFKGLGLQNIANRAVKINAKYSFTSLLKTGTTFTITIPLPADLTK